MRTPTTMPVLAGACLLLGAACGAGAQEDGPAWRVGQTWVFLIKDYGVGGLAADSLLDQEKGLVPRVAHQFHVRASVTRLVTCGGRECVHIRFRVEPDAPVINSTNPPKADVLRTYDTRSPWMPRRGRSSSWSTLRTLRGTLNCQRPTVVQHC